MENLSVFVLSHVGNSKVDNAQAEVCGSFTSSVSASDVVPLATQLVDVQLGECILFLLAPRDADDKGALNCGVVVKSEGHSVGMSFASDQVFSTEASAQLFSTLEEGTGSSNAGELFVVPKRTPEADAMADARSIWSLWANALETYSTREDVNKVSSARIQDESLAQLSELLVQASVLADEISAGFKRVQSEPVNMRILSGRLEGAGAALGTISQNYDKMAGEMALLVENLRAHEGGALKEMHDVFAPARNSLLVANFLQTVLDQSVIDDEFKGHVAEAVAVAQSFAKAKLQDVMDLGRTVPDTCRQVRRRINGLDVVKLLCRVESGRLTVTDGGLNGIIDRLELFHNETDQNLAMLSKYTSKIVGSSGEISDKLN